MSTHAARCSKARRRHIRRGGRTCLEARHPHRAICSAGSLILMPDLPRSPQRLNDIDPEAHGDGRCLRFKLQERTVGNVPVSRVAVHVNERLILGATSPGTARTGPVRSDRFSRVSGNLVRPKRLSRLCPLRSATGPAASVTQTSRHSCLRSGASYWDRDWSDVTSQKSALRLAFRARSRKREISSVCPPSEDPHRSSRTW